MANSHSILDQIAALLPIAAIGFVVALGGERSPAVNVAALSVAIALPFAVVAALRGTRWGSSRSSRILNRVLLVIYGIFVLGAAAVLIRWYATGNIA